MNYLMKMSNSYSETINDFKSLENYIVLKKII